MKTDLIERINSYLNKYQSFNPQPANDKDIKQAEVMLNVVFDSDYKQFETSAKVRKKKNKVNITY